MNPQITSYIKTKREAGVADDQISANLIANGWSPDQVSAALKTDLQNNDAPIPPPFPGASPSKPIAVVSSFSTVSVEYVIMFLSLWISATAIGSILHAAVDGIGGSKDILDAVTPFASAALIVSLPLFVFLFARLKRKEENDSALRKDESRKQAIRLTLLGTFIIAIGHIISYVYGLLAPASSYHDYSIGTPTGLETVTNLLHVCVTLLIAGGIFVYYWRDIHKSESLV